MSVPWQLAPFPPPPPWEVAARSSNARGRLLLTTRPITLDRAAHSRLFAAVRDVVRVSAPGGAAFQAQLGEARLIAAIADVLLEQSAVVRAQWAATARIAELEGWIEAHLHHPITVGRLCQIAGVGQRGLEKLFESRRGMSPMRFVTERRLAAVHRLLMHAGPLDDVTRIAFDFGFGHMGRFAAVYRQAFGETPAQTLRRARRAKA